MSQCNNLLTLKEKDFLIDKINFNNIRPMYFSQLLPGYYIVLKIINNHYCLTNKDRDKIFRIIPLCSDNIDTRLLIQDGLIYTMRKTGKRGNQLPNFHLAFIYDHFNVFEQFIPVNNSDNVKLIKNDNCQFKYVKDLNLYISNNYNFTILRFNNNDGTFNTRKIIFPSNNNNNHHNNNTTIDNENNNKKKTNSC